MTVPMTTGMSLALPRAGSLTDALMAPPSDTVSAEELRVLREQLAGDLAALVEELPPGEKLRLDEFRFGQAREHPDRLSAVEGPFVASPARCRRAVGLGAVARCLGRRSPSPGAAVAEVLAAGVEDAADGGDPGARPRGGPAGTAACRRGVGPWSRPKR